MEKNKCTHRRGKLSCDARGRLAYLPGAMTRIERITLIDEGKDDGKQLHRTPRAENRDSVLANWAFSSFVGRHAFPAHGWGVPPTEPQKSYWDSEGPHYPSLALPIFWLLGHFLTFLLPFSSLCPIAVSEQNLNQLGPQTISSGLHSLIEVLLSLQSWPAPIRKS
jgi:hypothetical protein